MVLEATYDPESGDASDEAVAKELDLDVETVRRYAREARAKILKALADQEAPDDVDDVDATEPTPAGRREAEDRSE